MRDGITERGRIRITLLSLLGVPFVGVGIFALWLAISVYYAGHVMQTWPTVPARIEEVNLEVVEDDDGDSYRTTARYSYEYGGMSYSGQRVSLTPGADSSSSFHEDVFKELDAHRVQGVPFRAYVNPKNPGESILYPNPRGWIIIMDLVIALVFGGVGAVMVLSCIWSGRPEVESMPLSRGSMPQKPWETRHDWRTGVIQSSTKGVSLGLLAFSVLWLVLTSPGIVRVVSEGRAWSLATAVLSLFSLIGLLLLALSVKLLLVWRRYGVSTLRLRSVPAEPGGVLEGDIEVRAPLEGGAMVKLELSCTRGAPTGNGKHRRSDTQTLWSGAWKAAPERRGGERGCRIPVSQKIPDDAAESSVSEGVTWLLRASASVSGVDFVACFEVPVFRERRIEAAE